MTPVETRYECPVCLGVTLTKCLIEAESHFYLDHCTRCGGVWFDAGEVHRLRARRPQELWSKVASRTGVHVMQCHGCSQLLERDGRTCPSCGWTAVLNCPVCQRAMESAAQAGVSLDACRKCKGVWFDHHELAAIWNTEFTAALERRRVPASVEAGGAVVEALAYNPFAAYLLVDVTTHAVAAGGQAAAAAAPDILAAAGEASSSLFETIADIISGLFG